MKKVLHASDLFEDKKEEKTLKPIEFRYRQSEHGWSKTARVPQEFEKIVYLGYCNEDGDMFAAYDDGSIEIFRGALNDGIIE